MHRIYSNTDFFAFGGHTWMISDMYSCAPKTLIEADFGLPFYQSEDGELLEYIFHWSGRYFSDNYAESYVVELLVVCDTATDTIKRNLEDVFERHSLVMRLKIWNDAKRNEISMNMSFSRRNTARIIMKGLNLHFKVVHNVGLTRVLPRSDSLPYPAGSRSMAASLFFWPSLSGFCWHPLYEGNNSPPWITESVASQNLAMGITSPLQMRILLPTTEKVTVREHICENNQICKMNSMCFYDRGCILRARLTQISLVGKYDCIAIEDKWCGLGHCCIKCDALDNEIGVQMVMKTDNQVDTGAFQIEDGKTKTLPGTGAKTKKHSPGKYSSSFEWCSITGRVGEPLERRVSVKELFEAVHDGIKGVCFQRNETPGIEYSMIFRSPNKLRREENASSRRYLLPRKAQYTLHRRTHTPGLGRR